MSRSVNIQFVSGLPEVDALPADTVPEVGSQVTHAEPDVPAFPAVPGVPVLTLVEPFEPAQLSEEAFLRRLREVGGQADARGDRLMVEVSAHYDPEESLRLSGVEPDLSELCEPALDVVVGMWDAWGQSAARLGARSGRGLYPWATQCEVAACMIARDCAEFVLGLGPEDLVTGEVLELAYFSETLPGQGTRYWAEGRVLIGDADEHGALDANGLSATVQVTMALRVVPGFENLRRTLLGD